MSLFTPLLSPLVMVLIARVTVLSPHYSMTSSSQNHAAARDKREERNSHDVSAPVHAVALFSQRSPVSLKSGIGDCGRSPFTNNAG